MAKAYTPGLRVSARCIYRTRRALPTAGKVQVALGDRVQGATVMHSRIWMAISRQ